MHGIADTAALLTQSSSLDASRIASGTLAADRFDAYADLTADQRVGAGENQLAPGNHGHGPEDVDAYGDLQAGGQIGTGVDQLAPGIHAHGSDDIDAYTDLQAGGRVGNGAEQVASGVHAHDADAIDAYADLQVSGRIGLGAAQIASGAHLHDDRYARTDDGVVDTLHEMTAGCADGDLVRFGNGGWLCVAPDAPIPPDPGPGPCREAVVAPNGMGANVLDYIHPDHHAKIRDKSQVFVNPPVDFGPCIQSAIDAVAAVHDKNVSFPAGTYTLGQTLTLPSGIRLSGTGLSPYQNPHGASMIIAIADAQGERLEAMMTMESVGFIQIEGLVISGGLDPIYARAGVEFDRATHVQIRNNYFINFFGEDAAIYGGGGLYMTIEENVFSVGGFAIDSLPSYSEAEDVYYGINVGTIASNEVYSAHGIRLVGTVDILHNTFEGRVDSTAMINIQGEVSSDVNITGNYFELSDGATRLKAIRLAQANATVTGNRIFGDVAHYHEEAMSRDLIASRSCGNETVAIDAGYDGEGDDADHSNYIGVIEISRNSIARWDCGITHRLSAVNRPTSSISTNIFLGVLKPIPYVYNDVMPYDPGAPNTTDHSALIATVPGGGTQFRNTAIVPTAIPIAPGSTTIDLARGNLFYMMAPVGPDPVTITSAINPQPGQFFTMKFPDGNVALKQAVFQMAAKRDITPPAGSALQFVVNYTGGISEVGNTTLTLGLQKRVTFEVEPLAEGESVDHQLELIGAEPTYTAIHASSAQPPLPGIIYQAFAIASHTVTVRITNVGHPTQDPLNPPTPPSMWKITGTRCP